MAAGEKKVSAMTFLADVPDDAKIYVVKPGVTTPYYTTKAALLAGISAGITPTLPQVLAQGDEAISDDGLKKIQIDKEAGSVKIYTRPTTGDVWVLKGEYAYNSSTITDGTDLNTISANFVSITDGVIEIVLTKSGLQFSDFINGNQTVVNALEFFLSNGIDETSYQRDKIQVNGTDYPLPTGASSPFATVAQIPTINENYKGTYTSLSALETAHPTASSGNYAIVDAGAGNDAIQYIWDAQDGWVSAGTSSLSTTDALTEGTINLYFTVARVLAAALTGLSLSDGSDVTSANSILQAIGKLQKQLTDVRAAKEDKRSYMSQSSPRFLDNTTALQKIFNVGSSGNGSMPVTAGRKYRVKGWAVFSALSISSKSISFGLLGTATGSYTSGISLGAVSAALANTQIFNVGSFSAVQVAAASTAAQARILIDLEFNCNGTGFIIPSVLFSVSQANMQVDSAYFERFDIGEASSNSTSDII